MSDLRDLLGPLSADEFDDLRRWKTKAIAVLTEWEKLWEAAGCPGGPGQSKVAAVADEMRRLQALTNVERLSGCDCDDVIALNALVAQLRDEVADWRLGSDVEADAGDEARAEVWKLNSDLAEARRIAEQFRKWALDGDPSDMPDDFTFPWEVS